MLSTEIASLTGKRHDNVIRDIESIVKQLNEDSSNLSSGFKSTTYIAGNGKHEKCYSLDYEATILLLTGYSVPMRKKVIERWQELEKEVKNGLIDLNHGFESSKKSLELAPLAVEAAKAFGFTGNQAYLSADKAIQTITSISPLYLMGVELVNESQERNLTPTEIGNRLGLSAIKTNLLISQKGLQFKNEENEWNPTEIGKEFGVLLDTGKKHKSGIPVQQLKWKESILAELTK